MNLILVYIVTTALLCSLQVCSINGKKWLVLKHNAACNVIYSNFLKIKNQEETVDCFHHIVVQEYRWP